MFDKYFFISQKKFMQRFFSANSKQMKSYSKRIPRRPKCHRHDPEKKRRFGTKICKSAPKGNVSTTHFSESKNKKDFTKSHKLIEKRDQIKILSSNVTEKTSTTESFNVSYDKTIRTITNETSENQAAQEQYYGKKITCIVLLSTVSTILIFAIMFAICKRTYWFRLNKFRK